MTETFDEVFKTYIEKAKNISVREYRGLFLNADITDDRNIDRWFKEGLPPHEIERLLNHLHVYDIASLNDYPEEIYDDIADEIEAAWRERLDKSFIVERFEDYGPTLTFYRKRGLTHS
ncbi:hypothetical protein SAMN04488515_2928 [Cognatiyoonia koreensis]|uniref:Uncharacterized protein n=1 Tax=Cognatiyoonia koreensis TaxID=364200 RepID=A0A1I0RMD8_9RHOB|nr:hypothetical protein [Cognatiyoonia koreensis]SEW42153.1 hypothetical protein SAMN04488515_2928 [Cognatiyoonia koreensis]